MTLFPAQHLESYIQLIEHVTGDEELFPNRLFSASAHGSGHFAVLQQLDDFRRTLGEVRRIQQKACDSVLNLRRDGSYVGFRSSKAEFQLTWETLAKAFTAGRT